MKIVRTVICTIFALVCFGAPVAAQNPVPASERVKACDRQIALTAAEEIIKSPESLQEPLPLIAAATVLFNQGRKDEAVFWSWVAQLKLWHRVAIPKVDELLTNMRRPTASPIANYALQDTRKFERILARVQERDRDTLTTIPERRQQVYRNLGDLRARIAAQRKQIEEQARTVTTELEQKHASMRASTCLRFLIHPADAPQLIATEHARVVELVKNQREVIRAVGVVRDVSSGSYTVPHDHLLPSRYEVVVKGDKTVFAIVDVSRDASKAEFKLACLVRTPIGHRDPFKDPCKQ